MEIGIFEAIQNNNLELVRTFPNVNVSYPDHYSALMVACEEADLPIIQDLIARGAIVNTFNDYGHSPLILAAWGGRDDIVQELLNNGALIDAMHPILQNINALISATEHGHLSTVRLLLNNGANPLLRNVYDRSMIDYAHGEIYQELINRGIVNPDMPELEPQPVNELAHPGQVPAPRAAEVLPPEEENNPFAHRLQCSVCLTNAVNTRLNPCGHLICSECFVRLNPKRCPICRVEPVNDEPIFYGGSNNFYNKYKKYSTKLKNF